MEQAKILTELSAATRLRLTAEKAPPEKPADVDAASYLLVVCPNGAAPVLRGFTSLPLLLHAASNHVDSDDAVFIIYGVPLQVSRSNPRYVVDHTLTQAYAITPVPGGYAIKEAALATVATLPLESDGFIGSPLYCPTDVPDDARKVRVSIPRAD